MRRVRTVVTVIVRPGPEDTMSMTRVGLLAFVFVLSGNIDRFPVAGHVWNQADTEPTYTQVEPDRTRGHQGYDVDIVSGSTRPSEGRAPKSLEEPDQLHYRPSSGVHSYRQGPIKDPYVITTFAEKLHRSLERSTHFNSRPDYHACLTGSGIKGCCTPIRLCVLPVFLESLDVFLKYTCAIDNDHIGVCCPADFVAKPSAPKPRPDITAVIVTPGASRPVGGPSVVSPSEHRTDGGTTVHVVVVTGHSKPTPSRPVYPPQHEGSGSSGHSRPTASRPVYPVQDEEELGHSGSSRPVYPVPHGDPDTSGTTRRTTFRPVYPAQHGDSGTSGQSRPVYPVPHEHPGNVGNTRPSGSRPEYPVQQGTPGLSNNRDGDVSVNRHVGPVRNSTMLITSKPSTSKPSTSKPGSSKTTRKPQGSHATLQNTTTTRRPATSRPGAEPHAHMKRTTPRPEPPELQELRSTCGIPVLHKRIVGGQEANPNQWAWMAALMRSETGEHYCGGALISNRYVVTAAHCTVGLKAANITVRLGAYDIQEPSEHVKDIEVSRIRQHPQFQKDTFMNDIAVLRLKRPVMFNEYIRPVCLPQRSDETFFGKTAVAIGWGTQSFGGPYSDVLREVKLVVWNNTQCRERFAQPITDVFLCAGPKKREGDACQGDSGGPLMVQSRSKQWTLIGVISWGIKCGEPGFPGIYTRITHFLDYIYEHAVNQ